LEVDNDTMESVGWWEPASVRGQRRHWRGCRRCGRFLRGRA